MRRLVLLPIVLLAACGPRAVLGQGAHAPAIDGDVATPITGATLDGSITVVSAATTDESSDERPLGERPSGIIISRLPAPHRIAAAEAPAPRTIADAFALVGHRDSRESFAFALAVAASLGAETPSVADGPALVAAHERSAFATPGARLAPRDLLVFDRAAANAPASLVGVVLATDDRGVTSFLYLARGVVRIGHIDPARPHIARDREGRSVNSYIRHTTDYPPAGTRYLAGELLAGSIRLSSRR